MTTRQKIASSKISSKVGTKRSKTSVKSAADVLGSKSNGSTVPFSSLKSDDAEENTHLDEDDSTYTLGSGDSESDEDEALDNDVDIVEDEEDDDHNERIAKIWTDIRKGIGKKGCEEIIGTAIMRWFIKHRLLLPNDGAMKDMIRTFTAWLNEEIQSRNKSKMSDKDLYNHLYNNKIK